MVFLNSRQLLHCLSVFKSESARATDRGKRWNLDKFSAVKDFEVSPHQASEIVSNMGKAGGFTGRNLAEASDILKKMWKERDCYKILSFTADIVSTGLRGVVRQLLRDRKFDMVITTCGTLDHDIARSFAPYLEGDFALDDKLLLKKGYHRLGNIVIPKESYGPTIEKFLQPLLHELYASGKKSLASYELAWEAGKKMENKGSILYWAARNNIPVIVPGISDGAFGSQLWLFYQTHRDFHVDILKDEQMVADAVFDSNKLGALMVGGGISKHHTIWWAQFKGGLDYAVYITTAVEYDGSLSGAWLREAISWGKVKPKAKHVTVYGDATAVLPFIVSSAL